MLSEWKTDLDKETADGWCPLSDAGWPMERGTTAVCSVLPITAHCVQGLAEPDSYITPHCNRRSHRINIFNYFYHAGASSQHHDYWFDPELSVTCSPLICVRFLWILWFSPSTAIMCLVPCNGLASHSGCFPTSLSVWPG